MDRDRVKEIERAVDHIFKLVLEHQGNPTIRQLAPLGTPVGAFAGYLAEKYGDQVVALFDKHSSSSAIALRIVHLEELEPRIKQIIVDELGVDEAEVTPNARFIDDLGADSLDTVELVMRLEEEFGVEIPDEDAEKLQSVRDLYMYIGQHTK